MRETNPEICKSHWIIHKMVTGNITRFSPSCYNNNSSNNRKLIEKPCSNCCHPLLSAKCMGAIEKRTLILEGTHYDTAHIPQFNIHFVI